MSVRWVLAAPPTTTSCHCSPVDPHVTVFTGGAEGTHIDLPVATGKPYPDEAPVKDSAIPDP